jgi:hypothetical protein
MSPEIEELYQEVILDHSRRPRILVNCQTRRCWCMVIIRRAGTKFI